MLAAPARTASGARAMVSRAALLLLAAAATGCLGGGSYTPIQTSFDRGVYLDSRGDYPEAITWYRRALEENEGDQMARFNLAMASEALARELAEIDSVRAAALRRQARASYETILAAEPDHPRAALNLAAVEYEDDPEAGKARLRALVARHPDRARPRAALAAHLLREGADAEALTLLRGAGAADAAGPQVNLLLGDALLRDGQVGAARDAYRAVLRSDDEEVGALLALARLESDAGRPEEAVSYLLRVLYVDADHFEAHWLMAAALESVGDLEGATSHLWHARRLRPGGVGDDISERLVELYRRLTEAETAGG